MRLFRRPSRSRFPGDMLEWLDLFGRHRLDPMNSRANSEDIWRRIVPLIEDAKHDRDGFLTDLAALIENDRSGFVTLGASGVVWEIFSGEALEIPAALPLIDAGIATKFARGLPTASLIGYERQRLYQRGDQA